jgi:hypothetical protein
MHKRYDRAPGGPQRDRAPGGQRKKRESRQKYPQGKKMSQKIQNMLQLLTNLS